ncbi:MAG: hypothetical protein MR265_00670 [Erysipelotrichaceae bacterium]|nr:hypothetical protein [Erysipelotrichaceae bacterium]
MKGNKILYAGASLAVLAIGFAAGTYAYYQNTITGTASGTVLAWNCTANTKGDGEQFTISLGSLYPGSSGSKTITIASSILADYRVTFNTFTNMGTGSNHPNLNLYKDSGFATKINASDTIDGEVTAGGTEDVTFYYNWPYGSAKEDYNSSAPSVSVTVTCSQK